MPNFSLPDNEDKHELFLLERKTLFSLIAVSFLTLLIYFFGTDARDLFTSIIKPLPEHAPFDGIVYPVKHVPDWVNLNEEEREASFDMISSDKFMELPKYIPARLATATGSLDWDNPEHNAIRNEKITYAVPYMGNYKLDGHEYTGSHPAVDIKVPLGTPIYAITNGVVTKISETNGGFGYHVVIQHNNVPSPNNTGQTTTLHSAYTHLSRVMVKEYEVVQKGQMIGLSGQTGTATTPHLHFQIDTDEAPWHPYWPFTGKEALDAGLSFFEAINAGLGKDKALLTTTNPMVYVQKYMETTALVASLSKPDAQSVSINVLDKARFVIAPTEKPISVNKEVVFNIRLINPQGSLIKTPSFDERVSVELLNNRGELSRKFLTAGFFATGETNAVSFKPLSAGVETIIVRFREQGHTSEPLEILEQKTEESIEATTEIQEPAIVDSAMPTVDFEAIADKTHDVEQSVKNHDDGESTLTLATESSSPLNRGERIVIEVKNKPAVLKQSITMKLYYYDASDRLTNPPEGVFFPEAVLGVGSFSPKTVQEHNFQNGIAEFTYTPEEQSEQFAVRITYRGMKVVTPPFVFEKAETVVIHEQATEPAPSFTDVLSGTELYEPLKILKDAGVIAGYPDGTFRPDREVMRVEALKMIFVALKESVKQSAEKLFPDLEDEAWYLPYVNTGVKQKVVKGYPDGTFRPNANVNMVEFYKMLFLAAKTDINPEIIVDLPEGVLDTDWYAPYIQEAVRKNILEIKENILQPGKSMTRGEIAVALYKLYKLQSN